MLTASVFVLCFNVQAFASTIEFKIDDTSFISEKDGVIETKTLEASPFINENGRTMVPIRAISDAFGAEISWNGETREVLVKNSEKEIILTIDSDTALVNNETKVLDSVPVIVNNRTFVPLRFIGEAFSYNVNFAQTSRQVIIDDTPAVLACDNTVFSFAEFKTLYDLFYQSSYAEAMDSGITEEELKTYVLNSALETAYSINKISNAFTGINFTLSDLDEIRLGIETDNQNISVMMPGLNALVHEKYYFSLGNTVLNDIIANSDIESLYNTAYVCAKHILVEDETLAKDIHKKAISGEDFNSLVTTYGTDPGMTQNPDGYIFTKGEMVAEFESSAFSLEIGAISEPVKTTYGYHIIKREALPSITKETAYNIANQIAMHKLQNSSEPKTLITAEELAKML